MIGLAIFTFVILAPIWSVHYPAILDFPNHVASSFVLARLHDPAYIFGQYYAANWGLKPYITTDFVMMELGRVVPPLVAGKIALSVGALGLPLAAWFFLKQIHPGETALSLWFLTVAHNIFFRYGFVGYLWSMGLAFLAVALWLRWLAKPSFPRWIAAFLALTATYFTHIFGFIFAVLIIGLYSLTRPDLRRWLWSAALAAPSVMFYFISSRAIEQTGGAEFRPLVEKLQALLLIFSSESFLLDLLCLAAVGAVFAFGWIKNREFHWDWRWLVVVGGMLAAFAALPVGYGDGWNVDIRALPMFLVLLFATVRLGRRGWWFVPLALAVFMVRAWDVTRDFRSAQPEMEGLAGSFSITERNVRVLPIVEATDDDPLTNYFAHFWAYGVAERGWFSPYLFQMPGLLPLRITQDTYTLDGFWDLIYTEKPDWEAMREDYDYVWGYDVPQQYLAGLNGIGRVVYTSGKLQLFRVVKKTPARSP